MRRLCKDTFLTQRVAKCLAGIHPPALAHIITWLRPKENRAAGFPTSESIRMGVGCPVRMSYVTFIGRSLLEVGIHGFHSQPYLSLLYPLMIPAPKKYNISSEYK